MKKRPPKQALSPSKPVELRSARRLDLTLNDADPVAPPLAVVTGRRASIRVSDQDKPVVIDFTEEGAERGPLIDAIVKAIVALHGSSVIRPTYRIREVRHAVAVFLDYLSNHDAEGAPVSPADPTQGGAEDELNAPTTDCVEKLTGRHMYRFRDYLVTDGRSYQSIRGDFYNVRELLKQFVEHGHVLQEDVIPFLGRVGPGFWKDATAGSSWEPYTPTEVARLEEACKAHIAAVSRRLEQAQDLISRGADPRIVDWGEIKDRLWYLHHELGGAPSLERHWVEASGEEPALLRVPELYDMYTVRAADIAAYYVLFALKSGIPVESVARLKLKDIRDTGGQTFTVHYLKSRAEGHEHQSIGVRAEGIFDTGSLLRALIRITAPLREHMDEAAAEHLFVAMTMKGSGSGRGNGYRVEYTNIQPWRLPRVARLLTDNYSVLDDKGRPLDLVPRRFRPTHKTRVYRATQGNVGLAGLDHRDDSTTALYIDNEQTRPIHEVAIATAQHAVVAKLNGVVVAEADLEKTEQALQSAAGLDPDTARSIARGAQDMFVASCRDFYNRPGGPANTPCDQAWGCFECRNAVWTSRILPRVIRFHDFLVEQRGVLEPEDWEAKFGTPYAIITQDILPAFPEGVLAAARLAAPSTPFYIPIRFKTA